MLKKILFFIAHISAFFFLIFFIYKSLETSNHIFIADHFPIVLISLLFVCLAFFFQTSAWNISMDTLGLKLTYTKAMYLFSLSALTAYIPGKFPGLIIAANAGKKFNISPYLLGIGLFHFHLFSLSTILLLSLVILLMIATIQISTYFILVILVLFQFLLFITKKTFYLNKYLNYLIKIFKIDLDYQFDIKGEKILKIFFILTIGWIFISMSFYSLSFVEIQFFDKIKILKLIGIFFLSYLLGALAIIVPSGLGIFEITIYFGLQSIMDESTALILAASIRLIMLTPAILFFLIFKISDYSTIFKRFKI